MRVLVPFTAYKVKIHTPPDGVAGVGRLVGADGEVAFIHGQQLDDGIGPAQEAGHIEGERKIKGVSHPELENPPDAVRRLAYISGERRIVLIEQVIQEEHREEDCGGGAPEPHGF